MSSLAVTVIGRDRPGIIAEVTAVVAGLGGNLEDSSMTLLRGHFAWMLVADVAATPVALSRALEPLRADGLVVSVLPVADDRPYGHDLLPYVLSVHGADRPGIVAAVTSRLARHGGNITDLSTRLGSRGLYVLVAEASLPSSVDVDALSGELAAVARELGVEVRLRPADTDTL